VLVFATLVIAGVLAVMFGEMPSIVRGAYIIYIDFSEAPGVTVDTPIRKSGIRIGRVTNVKFEMVPRLDDKGKPVLDELGHPVLDEKVRVTAKIDGERQLYHDEKCWVTVTLLGDSSLQFVRAGPVPEKRRPIKDGEIIQGAVQIEPVQAMADLRGGVAEAISSVTATSKQIGEAAAKLREVVTENEQNIETFLKQSSATLTNIEKISAHVSQLVEDPKWQAQFKDTAARLPQIVQDMQTTINKLSNTLDSVDRNLKHIEGFTRPLGERGTSLVARLDQTAEKLDSLVEELLLFSQALNDQRGTLGQLVYNPELYQRLNRAARNVEELTRELRPIVDDARVLSDKLSRHPGVIVRDAIRPGPGIK
jgi:phospholipid/cholesterol/gamma-HCH transport system substrate-binding protein